MHAKDISSCLQSKQMIHVGYNVCITYKVLMGSEGEALTSGEWCPLGYITRAKTSWSQVS